MHIFLDIKDLHSAWLANAATFCNILGAASIFLQVFKGFSAAQIILIQLFSIMYSQKFTLRSQARQGITVFPIAF
jgi:hypothetical protein